jgi:RimJ/RimL family protein N-acetyltransferase
MPHDASAPLRRVPMRGEELVVRLAEPDDAGLLRALFASLSVEDRYLRFFSAFRPDDEFVERLATANDHGARELLALVTGADGEERLVGEAGAWPLANGNGELGITVAPGRRGWLGPYLLDALLESAAAIGMPNLEADVLVTNRRMLALVRSRGFATVGRDGFRSVRMAMSTSGSTPSWAPNDTRTRVLVETPGGGWVAPDAIRSRPLQVVACSGPEGRPRRRPCPALAGMPCPLAAGADAIVVRLPDDDDDRAALLHAHAALHAGVPVCVQSRGDDAHVVELIERVGRPMTPAGSLSEPT